jgi:hypothetical protein
VVYAFGGIDEGFLSFNRIIARYLTFIADSNSKRLTPLFSQAHLFVIGKSQKDFCRGDSPNGLQRRL